MSHVTKLRGKSLRGNMPSDVSSQEHLPHYPLSHSLPNVDESCLEMLETEDVMETEVSCSVLQLVCVCFNEDEIEHGLDGVEKNNKIVGLDGHQLKRKTM